MLVKAVMAPTPSLAESRATGRAKGENPEGEFVALDVYRLPESDLSDVTGIALAGDVDQIFLAQHQATLDDFVRGGGRVLVNGHVQRPFLTGLTRWRKLVFERPADLRLTRHADHPVWRGSRTEDFLYSTGEPGPHEWERLEQIGVAGFYGRGYTAAPPADAIVIHTIGPTCTRSSRPPSSQSPSLS